MNLIIDTKPDLPFVAVPREFMRDVTCLSWKSKAIWIYLLSCPPGWIVRLADLVNRSTDGKAAILSALQELEQHGFLQREQEREAGRFSTTRIRILYPPLKALNCEKQATPETDFPLTEKPYTEKPLTENRTHTYHDVKETDITEIDISSKAKKSYPIGLRPKRWSEQHEATFNAFWDALPNYPHKSDKGRARDRWADIEDVSSILSLSLAAIMKHSKSKQWLSDGGKWIPKPANLIKGEFWEDIPDIEKRREGYADNACGWE